MADDGAPRGIDLNADLGEGFGRWSLVDDVALLDLVSSANVACGFHAGDPSIMRAVCAAAADRGVAVGAHVAYRDLVGFGRRYVAASRDELRDDVVYQVGALAGCARAAGTSVAFVKPHGALYNRIFHDEEHAGAIVDALVDLGGGLPVVGLPGSAVLRLARAADLTTVTEAFGDRGYRPDGTLVPRNEPSAVVTDAREVAERVLRLAAEGTVVATDGSVVVTHAATVCVHSDTPGSVEMLRAVRRALDDAGVPVRPAVSAGPATA